MQRNLSEYKSAIPFLRKFSNNFSGANGYDLRFVDRAGYLTSRKKRVIDEWLDFLRPLTSYGFRTKKVKSKAEALKFYADYYGITEIPANLRKVIYQVDSSGKSLKKKKGRFILPSGIEIERYLFSANDRKQIALGDFNRLEYIWDFYAPDSVALIAGVNPVRSGGAPSLAYTLDQLKRLVSYLSNKYTGNHAIENWMTGLDLYYKTENKLRDYVSKESKKYNERKSLAKDLSIARANLSAAERAIKSHDENIKFVLKTIPPSDRHSFKLLSEKARKKLIKKLDSAGKKLVIANSALYGKK